ncbi:type III secretion protein HrpB4 [Paraburkholderia acidipaludis]|uniref:type III secretion protein HrpB4 n=1 Tax=Paraburkholderia acidipaludis TaxID=660537 RepID=UPI0005BE78A8|nr:type III secretion protein HrpB4 [Paraburkholderia acidipaludis]
MDARDGNGSELPGGGQPAAVAARLRAHHAWRRTLFEWMHPLRRAQVPCADRLTDGGAAGTAAFAEAMLQALGFPAPPLASFSAPGAALAVLPANACLGVFRLRALFDHGEEVRSWIDRPRRQRLNDWIGPRGTQVLLGQRRALSGAPLAAPLGRVDGDALAWIGYRLFERECGWTQAGPLAIAQLAMPEPAGPVPPLATANGPGRNASLSIVSQLPDLFPEWSW